MKTICLWTKPVLKISYSRAKNVLFTSYGQLFRETEGIGMDSCFGPTMTRFAVRVLESKYPNHHACLPLSFTSVM